MKTKKYDCVISDTSRFTIYIFEFTYPPPLS